MIRSTGNYDERLLALSAEHPLTADEIGAIVGCYGPDAVTRLRQRKTLAVKIVGSVPAASSGHRKKLYRVERSETGKEP